MRGEQREARPGRERARADVHHVLVRDVRVGEDDLVDLVLADQVAELGLGPDRDPVRVEIAGEQGRVDAPVDVRDLRRREGNDLVLLAAPVDDVEVVEVAPGRACDQDAFSRSHVYRLCTYTSDGAR